MAHIDALTAEVAAPLDRLVDIALQASKTTSLAKQHLLAGVSGLTAPYTVGALASKNINAIESLALISGLCTAFVACRNEAIESSEFSKNYLQTGS